MKIFNSNWIIQYLNIYIISLKKLYIFNHPHQNTHIILQQMIYVKLIIFINNTADFSLIISMFS